MTRYDLALLSGTSRLPLPTHRARGLSFATGPRGFQDLSCFLPLNPAQADMVVQASGLRARLTDGAGVLWEGRVEDRTLRNDGVQIGALGDSRALDDVLYTALWSDSDTSHWVPITSDMINSGGNYQDKDRYEMDANNRLYIAPKVGETYGSAIGLWGGSWGYVPPNGSLRQCAALDATMELYTGIGGWTGAIERRDSAWAYGGAIFTRPTEVAGYYTSTIDAITFVSCDRLVVTYYWDGGPITWTSATGGNFLKLLRVRVKSTQSVAIYADEIARALRDYVNSVNPGALSTSNRLIASPGVDLMQEVYEDMRPSDILDRLAGYGDSSGNKYGWGVYEDRALYLRPLGSGRQWAMDVADLEVGQRLDGLINSTYAIYKSASGGALRTAAQTNAASISREGLTRQGKVDFDTTSAATAASVAATATAATATAVPAARVTARRISTLSGAPARPEWVRADDIITIRNLPPAANSAIERVRTFRVAQTKYDMDTGEMEITPESPAPDLEFQIAFLLRQTR